MTRQPRPKNNTGQKNITKPKSGIQEIVREATAGGIVFRRDKGKEIEILLIKDPKGRWSIPKGHVEENETVQETAVREIREEAGLENVKVICWLGKTDFRYRRLSSLVMMTTHIYLVEAIDPNEEAKKEEFYEEIKWFEFMDALEVIEYEDIAKLMLKAKKRIREGA